MASITLTPSEKEIQTFVQKDVYKRQLMPYLYFGLILFMSIKAQRAVQELHLEKDDKSEIIYKTYSKRQIKVRSWLVFISIEIGLFAPVSYTHLDVYKRQLV